MRTSKLSTRVIPRFKTWPSNLVAFQKCHLSSKSTVLVDQLDGNDSGIAVVSLNNGKVNALSHALIADMNAMLTDLDECSETRVVIVKSALEKVFCAGADLKERSAMDIDETREFVKLLRSTMSRWERLKQPVIAAMEGAAFGGGLELALACDLRVASQKVKMGLVETRLAIIPGAGGTQRLARVVGLPLAKELILTAREFDANYAAKIGAVNRVCDDGQAYEQALELAREINKNGPIAIRAAKQTLNQGFAATDRDMLIEEKGYDIVLVTEDRVNAMEAFKKKEKPVWLNR